MGLSNFDPLKNYSQSFIKSYFHMKKCGPRVILLFYLTLSHLLSFSQQPAISGRVVDSNQEGIPGVTIRVVSTQLVSLSNAKGEFSISAKLGDVLVFSSVGFASKEVKVSSTLLEVEMVEQTNGLDEVVVVGYGTSRKKDLTGSVTSISSRDFQAGVLPTPEQLISGKAPGVSIISNSGQPGAGSTIRIRGGSSLSASNSPLLVIDGVPLDNDAISGSSNPLSFINSNDIESFTILKDASAAAIYGTRASNGVIIITTKKGRGAMKIQFSTLNSHSSLVKKVDVLSPDEFRQIVNERGTGAQISMLGNSATDWQDVIYRQAISTDNNLSVSGQKGLLPYRVSVGFQKQNGILKTDYLDRTSVSMGLNPTFLDKHLKVDLNLKGSLQKARFGNLSAIGAATSFDPTQPIYAEEGATRFGGYFEWLDKTSATGLVNLAGRNPLGLLNQRVDHGNPQRSIGNLQLDYKFHFLPEMHANLNLGYDVARGTGTVFESDSSASAYLPGGVGGTNNSYKQTKSNSLLEFYLNYIKDLKSIHTKLDVLAGYSFNHYSTTNYFFPSFNAKGEKYPNTDPAFPFDTPENTLISYFGRANLAFKDRYFLTATLRRDGSSRFSPANRWGLFPSIALAWNLKDETLFKGSKVISTLKLRSSYGVTGQQDGIGNYDYISYFSLSSANASYQFGDTFYQGFRPGGFYSNRKWEETASTNLAIDYGFLRDRISGSIDFYVKNTSDLLNNIPQPAGTNFSAFIVANVGSMSNKGVEFNLNLQPIRKNNLTWDVNFNATYNVNEITNLTVNPQDKNYLGFPSGTIAGGIGGQFAFINAVGFSRNTFNLYQQVYTPDGKPVEGVFVDQNGDGIINQSDLYKGKSAIPKMFFGLSSQVNYKKLNVGIVLRASVDNYVYNNNFSQAGVLNQILGNSVLYNASRNYLETRFRGNSQQLLSDYYIQNGSFIRMDNANIGYDLGHVISSNSNLRLSVNAQNVFLITKYKGLDPEVSGGIDNNLYPRPRIFSLGLHLDF